MKSHISTHSMKGIRLALLLLVCGSFILFKGWTVNCSPSVRITKFTAVIGYKEDVYYRLENGTFLTATMYRDNPTDNGVASVDVDWVFPEKMKGEFVKFFKPRPDIAAIEKLYYKHGRNIYKNSIKGEEKVYELPRCQNVKFEILIGSSFLFIMSND
ncbi:hypothetical protein BC833DRAFT_585702 [Globomyces pollinis-pini]|nr:hypothetical protein BC833DRAFT_585702 [Globomyces pollinis-pini]